MRQLIDKKNEMQFYTISEISEKIQRDIAYLRENLEIVSEEYEYKLVKDLEMFLLDGIVREIRLSIYDPLQNNMVFVEYAYKVARASSYSSGETWHSQIKIFDFPDSCLFDIFMYFTAAFDALEQEEKKARLENYNIDWYDLNFNLKYSNEDERKKTGVVSSERLSLGKYIYESSAEGRIETDGHTVNETEGRGQRDRGINKFDNKLTETLQNGHKLNYVVYNDLENAVASITKALQQCDKITIRWSVSRGFTLDDLSGAHKTDKVHSIRNIINPAAAIKFVLENEEERVSYIFDDFHHHLGGDAAVVTGVAEIRSLVRDLARELRARDEFVFFMSPSDSLPVELVPVFNIIKESADIKNDSFLNKYGTVLIDAAFCNKNKPLVGNSDKVKRITQILCQMETNNPLLVGEPGVGKTALIEGLASNIVNGNVPSVLKGKTIFSLNLNTLVAGSKYRGDFEERLNMLMDEVKSRHNELIVFIDEIHTLVGAGSTEGSSGAEDILKPALARGDFPCIGATTYEGFEILCKHPAFTRRFQKLDIPPAGENEAVIVLQGVKHIFEKHHEVEITDDAINAAVRLSEKYIRSQFLPGKAVRLLDSTSAFVKLDNRNTVGPDDIADEIKRGL
ncbi:MAG: AAA family ATPase [Candidatus Anammoxibacter sp.]